MKLVLKAAPALRVDMRGITPAALQGLDVKAVAALTVTHGREAVALGDLFSIDAVAAADELRFEGDLSRFDRVGWQSGEGRIVVDGSVGDYAGAGLRGGAMHVHGDAGALAACAMSGGELVIGGSVGDFAASALPGDMDGMRGGLLVVRGSAGARFGDRMRRGTALVFGAVGDFAASRMVAGTIAVAGGVGAQLGFGMRRGSVVLLGAEPKIEPRFVPALVEPVVFWQLLSRDLARHGGAFAELPQRRIERRLGDLATGGKGELILAS